MKLHKSIKENVYIAIEIQYFHTNLNKLAYHVNKTL